MQLPAGAFTWARFPILRPEHPASSDRLGSRVGPPPLAVPVGADRNHQATSEDAPGFSHGEESEVLVAQLLSFSA